jgi:lipopolysaccharide/colanic/teichoic acid biosynthesis glycosyltransferase
MEKPSKSATYLTEIWFGLADEPFEAGLPGIERIRYRCAGSLEDSERTVRFDRYCVRNAAPWPEFRVLFQTVRVVPQCEGAD